MAEPLSSFTSPPIAPTPAHAVVELFTAYEFELSRYALACGLSRVELLTLVLLSDIRTATPTFFADQFHRTTGSITKLLDRLAKRGLISRQANPGDRRSLLISSCPAGQDIADGFTRILRDAAGTATVDDRSGVQTTVRVLRHITDAISDQP